MSCLHLVGVGLDKADVFRQVEEALADNDAILLLVDGLAWREYCEEAGLTFYCWGDGFLGEEAVVNLMIGFDKTASWLK